MCFKIFVSFYFKGVLRFIKDKYKKFFFELLTSDIIFSLRFRFKLFGEKNLEKEGLIF